METVNKNKEKDLDKNKNNEQEQQDSKRVAKEQEGPLKKHGVPEDPEERRNGGLAGAENFKRNMGCGG